MSCRSEPPAVLIVGPISWTDSDLLGLSDARRRTLADLAAFGLSVADSSTGALGAPLLERWENDRRVEVLAAELALERNGIGDDVLEARYLTDPQWELVVRHILFFSERWRSSDHRAQAEAKARRAMDALRAGADFAETAVALSEEPGAQGREGLLTPGREGSWVPEFWAAALALEPGQISPVTETQYGYHILRLEERRVVPFEEARATIVRRVASLMSDPPSVLDAWLAQQPKIGDDPRAPALAEADRRSIFLPEGERVDLARQWDDIVYRLSATLGFRYGASPAQVAEASLAALSDPAQGANLARTELAEHRWLLEARHPASLMTPGRAP
jgi:hypothetical protein